MANLARNASAESADGLTFSGGTFARRSTTYANTGTYSVELAARAGSSGLGISPSPARVIWELSRGLPGSALTSISLAVRELSPSNDDLHVSFDDGDGTFVSESTLTTGTLEKDTWHRWTISTSTPISGPDIRLRLGAQAAEGVFGWWHVDDLVVEGTPLAVKLAERAVDAIESLLQSNLSTELTAIDTDRGDGITMAAPANGQYYKREKAEVAGATAHVEIFESDWDFTNPYTDADAQRATYDLPVFVRVTCFNRDGDSADTMHARKRRYAAGVFNVINKNSDLGDSDDATINVVVQGVDTDFDRDAEDNISKVRATLRLLVKCEEVQ